MVRTLLQVLAILLTLESAYFFVHANIELSPTAIARLASVKQSFHNEAMRNLSIQRADACVGVVLLVVALSLQLINIAWPMRCIDFSVSTPGCCIAVLVGVLALFASSYISARVADATLMAARAAVEDQGI